LKGHPDANGYDRSEQMRTTILRNVQTQAGEAVTVMTKSHFLFLFRLPATSVMPLRATELRRRGVQFRWTTSDPEVLESLHNLVIEALGQVTLDELRGIADLGKRLLALGAPFIPKDAPLPDCLKQISDFVRRVV